MFFAAVALGFARVLADFLAAELEDLAFDFVAFELEPEELALDRDAFAPELEALVFEGELRDVLGEPPFGLCADVFLRAEELVLACATSSSSLSPRPPLLLDP